MNDLSKLANIAEIFSALVVVGGIIFAVIQMRQTRQQRRELAAIELFRSFGSPKFTEAYRNVLRFDDGMTSDQLKEICPECEQYAMVIATTMENIGVMMYQRIVPSMVVYHLIGSSAVILWKKLAVWAEDLRVEHGNPYAFEWFQWLAMQLDDMHDPSIGPAHESKADWKPLKISSEI